MQRHAVGYLGGHDALRRTGVHYEVVPRAPGITDRHAERHVPRHRRDRERHRPPALPFVGSRGRRALWAGERRRLGERRALGAGEDQRSGAEVDGSPPKRERTSEPSKPSGSPFPAHLRQGGGGDLLGGQGHAVERPRPHGRMGCAAPVQPTPANWVAAPTFGRWRRCASPASMVDSPAPVSRIKDTPLVADAHVEGLGHLSGNHAHRQRHLLAAAGLCGRPAAASGRRGQGEGDLRLDVDMDGRGPVVRPADSRRQDEHQHRDDDGHECDDEQTPAGRQRR